ncbi:MAG: AAA family ATPase [Cyanobacteria bacterium SBLK]|nr:AAA family ATPase [Cyanobacteria bacterium SBLK]
MSAISTDLPKINNYQTCELIYESDRTLVYRGQNENNGQSAVIKLMGNQYPSFNELVQFRNQYVIAKNLEVEGIIKPYTLERYENRYALIMEDVGGISLAEYKNENLLSVRQFLEIAIQLANVLGQLHQNQIIHKDIKPANILIHPETQQVKLIDFSISTLLPKETQTLQTPNVLEGTLAYLSPEQTGRMNRGIDYRSDFYSLGVTFYELLAGKLPFTYDDPLELIHAHIAQSPKLITRHSIPEVLSDIVLRLMAKNAEDRYQSALGLKYDLERCLAQSRETQEIESFELGERDLCDRFLIPEKLYGREEEVKTLLAAFERVSGGGASGESRLQTPPSSPTPSAELLLVAGFSGIGKTAVVNEVHKPIVRQRGYFIKGKFDQFNRNIPFSAFVQAFRDLMGQLLGESNAQLQQWKDKIRKALGENGQILIDVIPELERIIGKQPPVRELSGAAAQNRFNLVFEKFIAVFTTREHPLTLFLDDLQWADSASLNLMKVLMGNNQTGYLLLLGAYRDNEVFPAHPLMLCLGELEKQNATISTITLVPLAIDRVNQFVAETLSCSVELAAPLTDLVYQKTKGNPFFTTQFLKGLQVDGLIAFNRNLTHWQCDLVRVRDAALTDDVVEFMAGRLHKLPESTRETLKLAACIGNQFDLETLGIICEALSEEVATHLWNALQEGLILPQSQAYKFFQGGEKDDRRTEGITVNYRFLHDRVQQAAYSLIPEAQKQIVHYRIGMRLLARLSLAEREEKIFSIVNQINLGRGAIADAREKQQLLELNFQAGCKAKTATAYEAAKGYFQSAIALLANNAWENAYDRAFELHFILAEVQLMNVDIDAFEKTIAILLEFAHSALDNARVYVLKVNQYSLQGAYPQAIEIGLTALEQLGTTVNPNNIKQLVREDVMAVEAQLQNRPIEALLDLPAATHPNVKVEIELLMKVLSAAYINANRDLYSFAVVRSVRLSVEYGNIPKSIMTYASYGEWLALLHREYQRGMQFSELALQLSYKLDNKSERSSACFLLGGCVYVKAKPIQGAARLNYEGFLAGMESGELQYAGYNLFANIYNRLFSGENLAEIAVDLEKFWAIANKIHNDLALSVLEACRFFIQKLSRPTEEENREECAWLERHRVARSYLPLGIYNILQMHAAYLYEDFERGCDLGVQASQFLMACESCTIALGYYYYGSLNLLRRNADLSGEARQQIETNQAHLNTLAESCPENFLHKYWLVEAERGRVAKKRTHVLDLYDRAIAEAQKNGYIQEEALANELFAKFYLDWGRAKEASVYLQDAYYCYAQWGAKAKTDDLEQRYPELLKPILQSDLASSPSNPSIAKITSHSQTATVANISPLLDLSSLLKASQTLSGEIELDRLLSTLMKIILENAGATKGALLLTGKTGLTVEAIATHAESDLRFEFHQSIDLDTYPDLPAGLINYVRRTTETALFDAKTAQTQFAADNYLLRFSPQSLLCLPLLARNNLIGVLYLENNLTADAFTRDRVDLLDALCAQAAISLTNARLYQQARQALTDLQQAQLQLVQNEKMATLGNLVAGVAHEINNPLGFIGGNLQILQDNLADLSAIIEGYREEYPEPSPQLTEEIEELDLDFLLEDIPQTIASMEEGVKRIGNISTSLRTFSRTDADVTTKFDLHDGLDSTLLILKYRLKANEQRPAIEIVKNYGEIPSIDCYPGQLNQVFMNLLANAIDALDESNKEKTFQEIERAPNRITIVTELSEDKKKIAIRIIDNGMGMSEDIKARIFEPGFTTKGVGKGTGLGMAIAKSIVTEKHGGRIFCQSILERGTEFMISLPGS